MKARISLLFLTASLAVAGCGAPTLNQTIVAPSISPSSTLVPSATTMNISGLNTTATISAADPGYTGAISAVSSAPAVATVSASSTGPNASFTITTVAAGTATITLTDSGHQSASVVVTVTTSTVVVQ